MTRSTPNDWSDPDLNDPAPRTSRQGAGRRLTARASTIEAFPPALKVIPGQDTGRARVVSSEEPPSLDLAWFAAVNESPSRPVRPVDLIPVIAGLSELLKAGYFAAIDALMRVVRVEQASPEMLVCLLRTTYPARQRLRAWQSLLRGVRGELTRRGLETATILRGLS